MGDTPTTNLARTSNTVPVDLSMGMERALRKFCEAFNNKGDTTSLAIWNARMKEAYDDAQKVLASFSEPKDI